MTSFRDTITADELTTTLSYLLGAPATDVTRIRVNPKVVEVSYMQRTATGELLTIADSFVEAVTLITVTKPPTT